MTNERNRLFHAFIAADAVRREAAVMHSAINIVLDGCPGPKGERFVRIENDAGEFISIGTWIEDADGLWRLRIDSIPRVDGEDARNTWWAALDALSTYDAAHPEEV